VSRETLSNPIAVGLAFCTGIGLTVMMVAAGIGVVQGENADGALIGLLFVLGLSLTVVGIIAWFAAIRPDKHFDDINVPAPDDHAEHHDDHQTHEHAVAEHHA
jgi:hypothetical protein